MKKEDRKGLLQSTLNTPYDQGIDAYYDGLPMGDNPFDEAVESEGFTAWRGGWYCASINVEPNE